MLLDSYLILKAPIPQTSEAMGQGSQSGNNTEERKTFSLPEIIPEGERDNTLHRYACSLYVKGCSDDEVWYLIQKANEERCENPINEEQLTNLYRSAKRQWGNSDERRAKLNRIETIMAFSEAAKEQGQGSEDDDGIIRLSDIEELPVEWLVEEYMPKGEPTFLSADGGTGKTFIACDLMAAVSSGRKPFMLDSSFNHLYPKEPKMVLYFTTEDDNSRVMRPRMRVAGANLENIITIDNTNRHFDSVKLNSPFFEKLLSKHRPALCVFDPLQSFLPKGIDMSKRNDMRTAMNKLHGYGSKYGTSFLILMHTNKKQGVSGRQRLADSSDIWDIARSVLIAGSVDEHGETRYLSQEKSSYGKRAKTVLFRILDNQISFASYTDKSDWDFVHEKDQKKRATPAKNAAEEFILDYLDDHGEVPVADLDAIAESVSLSKSSLRDAKASLREQKKISYRRDSDGKGKGVKTFIRLTAK